MVKNLALFVFFAITAYYNLHAFSVITVQVLLGVAAFVLAVIYFLELIGRPVTV